MVMEMSKTYQYRKVMKPLLERKRRARINKCLDDLKDLMVECLTEEGEHVTRLEKADILELTVEHMRKLKQRGALTLTKSQTSYHQLESFRSGYVHAAEQISQVLAATPGMNLDVGSKVMRFLADQLIQLQTLQRDPFHLPLIMTETVPNIGRDEEMDVMVDVIKVESPSSSSSSSEGADVWRPW
ncbi:enhancer of split m3 protein [Episyrphus balteatus]|uniref:enhancer of split m3 protein n=1 Tax=Episyrphus balteatus TaxID=286459 RepID=UPI002486AF1E|nr:enhancer of split m3 protein [Episyrphus balteatus]